MFATLAVPLISLSQFTRPSRIVFGDGNFLMEGLNTLIQWMVDNRDKGYFKNLEYFQVTGHKATSHEAATNITEMMANIAANLRKMCTDKKNFPKLTQMNFNSNAYNEFNDGFDAALRNACSRSETGVSIRAMQVSVLYDTMCSTTNVNNLGYYDMSNDKEVSQCRYTWNWEMGDTLNTYGDGPYPNENTEPCEEPIITEAPTLPTSVVISQLPQTMKSMSFADGSQLSEGGSFSLNGFQSLRTLDSGKESFSSADSLILQNLGRLESIQIGENAFTNSKNSYGNRNRRFQVMNCSSLHTLELGRYSFSDYGTFELGNLPNLTRIVIGLPSASYNFYNTKNVHIANLPLLEYLEFGSYSFYKCRSIRLESSF